jgi:hypothetical protein
VALVPLETWKNPNEVAHDLVAITPSNPKLHWSSIDGEDHVLMIGSSTFLVDAKISPQ